MPKRAKRDGVKKPSRGKPTAFKLETKTETPVENNKRTYELPGMSASNHNRQTPEKHQQILEKQLETLVSVSAVC